MNKKALLFSFALLFLLAANLHLCCRVSVGGEWDSELYSLPALHRGEQAARAAAEEICRPAARLPQLRERLTLSFRPPRGDSARLSALILRRVPGVSPLYRVGSEGRRLGAVADREKLEERLRAALYSSMPATAVRGSFSPAVEITPVYGRSGSAMSPSEMALVVSGAVSAFYTDRDGNQVLG